MIDLSIFDNKFEITSLYKNDYIKIHTIYNQDFEEFSKTLYSLIKKLSEFKNDDKNLLKFFDYYWTYQKICNNLPISFVDSSQLLEKNKTFDYFKQKKILMNSYPGHEDQFEFVIKKFNDLKISDINIFLDQNDNYINNNKNLALNDTKFDLDKKFKFIKKRNFFTKLYDYKLESVSLFNPNTELLQLIAYLDVADTVNVYNFNWIKKDYKNLSLFVSNQNLTTLPLNVKYIESIKPQYTVTNELMGEIFDEDISLSTDLDEIIKKIENENKEDDNTDDKNLINQNNFDKIKSTLFQLSNGKIAFLRNESTFDQVQDVIVQSYTGKIEVKSKKVDLIKVGEFVLFKGDRATSLLEEETLLAEQNANIFYAQRKDWKDRLSKELKKLGVEKTIKKIKEYGGRKKISFINIKYWLYPKSLRTDDKETFLALMKLCGLSNKGNEIWTNMGELNQAHIKAGRIIKDKIKEVVIKSPLKELLKSGFQKYSLDQKGGGSLEAYKVVAKSKTLKVKFNLTDKPMSPSDL